MPAFLRIIVFCYAVPLIERFDYWRKAAAVALAVLVTFFFGFETNATVLKGPLKSAEPVEAKWLRVPGCRVCIITFYFCYDRVFCVPELRLLASGIVESFCWFIRFVFNMI